jgi:hypothetical protein
MRDGVKKLNTAPLLDQQAAQFFDRKIFGGFTARRSWSAKA